MKKRHKYYGQIQMGMAVLNLTKTYFVLYSSFDNSILVIVIDFDFEYAWEMLSKIKNNYFNNMVHGLCEQ